MNKCHKSTFVVILFLLCPASLLAQFSVRNSTSMPPEQQLTEAISSSDPAAVSALLKSNPLLARTRSQFSDGTPLLDAINFESNSFLGTVSAETAEKKIQVIKILLKYDTVNFPSGYGVPPLQTIVQVDTLHGWLSADLQYRVSTLLLESGADVFARDDYGNTALHFPRLNIKLTELLLNKGANVNAQNDEGDTPLHKTAFAGSCEVVSLLLHRGAKLDQRNNRGETPLHIAASRYNLSTIRVLLDAGADINALDHFGNLPVHLTVPFPDFKLLSGNDYPSVSSYKSSSQDAAPFALSLLLQRGAISDKPDQFGVSLLTSALIKRDSVSRDILLRHKVKKDTETEFFCAAATDNVTILEHLMKVCPNIQNYKTPTGISALHIAALWNAFHAVRILLSKGTDPNSRDGQCQTPLHYACSNSDNSRVVQMLLKLGADPNVANRGGITPLLMAVRDRSPVMVRALLTAKANPSLFIRQESPLAAACLGADDTAIPAFLIEAGANVSSAGSGITTPLEYALSHNNHSLLTLLLLHHASLKSVKDKSNLLCYAVGKGDIQATRLLLSAGANPNSMPDIRFSSYNGFGSYQQTALKKSIEIGSLPITELLLAHGADVNLIGRATIYSPLMTALYSRETQEDIKLKLVELLLAHGADVNYEVQGQNSLDFAGENKSIVQFLKQHGAKVSPYSAKLRAVVQ